MTRTVFCRKYHQELEGLPKPPFPGPRGQDIYDNVSARAWQEWQQLQTMLINEKRLNAFEPSTRAYLADQLEKFMNNQPTDHAEGYVPPA